jgi:hypothetical protein
MSTYLYQSLCRWFLVFGMGWYWRCVLLLLFGINLEFNVPSQQHNLHYVCWYRLDKIWLQHTSARYSGNNKRVHPQRVCDLPFLCQTNDVNSQLSVPQINRVVIW